MSVGDKGAPIRIRSARDFRAVTKDVLCGVVTCFLFLLFVETTLRIAGIRPAGGSDDPFVGFYGRTPLYDVHDGVALTSPGKLPMFNKVSFSAKKPPNTMRIFCFGGSTTYGQPYDGRSAFGRWLQDLLQASLPDTKFEVINAGGVSYASYRIVPLIKETLAFDPDLMIVYCGHNEFLERRTYRGLFRQGRLLVTLRSYVEQLALYEGLWRLWKPLIAADNPDFRSAGAHSDQDDTHSPIPSTGTDGKGRSLMDGEPTEIASDHEGMSIYRRDEEFSRDVVLHFAYNLRKIVELCKQANVPVILLEPPSNLKDFSPFKSEHSPGLTKAEQTEFHEKLASARKALEAERWHDAMSLLGDITAKDGLYAESYYWKGKALLGLGRNAEALTCFVKAKDLDVCPLRCITALRERITQVAKEEGAILIPLRERVFKHCSEMGDRTGIAGDESFLDHVHPTIELHQMIADLIYDVMVEKGIVRPSRGISPHERVALFAEGMKGFDPGFFVEGRINLAWVFRWYGKGQEARSVLRRVAIEQRDASLYEQLGHWLLEDGYCFEAMTGYETAVRLSDRDPRKELSLARAYLGGGREEDALAIFTKLTEGRNSLAEAYADLALAKLHSGEAEKALELVQIGMGKHPQARVLFVAYGLVLAAQGKGNEAIPWMEKALKADPENLGTLYELARLHATLGNTAQALEYLRKALSYGFGECEELDRDKAFNAFRRLPEFKRIADEMKRRYGR